MSKDELILISEMLKLASEVFSNHGCNDIHEDIISQISEPDKVIKSVQEWFGQETGEFFGDDPYPSCIERCTDSLLMEYLADVALKASKVPETLTVSVGNISNAEIGDLKKILSGIKIDKG